VASRKHSNPEIIYELLDWGTLRLLTVNQADVHAIINQELAPVWRNEQAVGIAVDAIARG